MTQAPVHESVRDRTAMIQGMNPVLIPGLFHFCTTADRDFVGELSEAALAMFREAEGISLILPDAAAKDHGFDLGQPMRCITLMVQSALDGVGLTAAVSAALAAADCPCNLVAAYHHDHAFVPADRAEEALTILVERAAQAKGAHPA